MQGKVGHVSSSMSPPQGNSKGARRKERAARIASPILQPEATRSGALYPVSAVKAGEYFRALSDSGGVGSAMVQLDGTIVWNNPVFQELLG